MSDSAQKRVLVLGSLQNKGDVHTRKVIAAYSPEVNHKTNISNIKKCKGNELEACAVLLGFTVRGTNEEKLYKNQDLLADRITLKIESLFESKCTDCEATYQNTLDDEPPLVCSLCMQGSHDCDIIKEKAESLGKIHPLGLAWLCNECFIRNDLSLLPEPTKKSKKPAPEKKKSSEEETEENLEENEEEVEDGVDVEEDSPRRDRRLEKPTNPNLPRKKTDPTQICPLYKKRECPHGLAGTKVVNGKKCDKAHPRRCFKYTRFGANGCDKGASCDYWHPKLCPQNLKNLKCPKEMCSFFHMQKMKTHAKEPRDDKPQAHGNGNMRRKGNIPAPRFSVASAMGGTTPYPPTDLGGRPPITRNKTQNQESFLLQKMENMKQGFAEQLSDLIKNEIPTLLKDLIRRELLTNLSAQTQLNPAQQMTQPPIQLCHPHPLQPLYSQLFPRSSC